MVAAARLLPCRLAVASNGIPTAHAKLVAIVLHAHPMMGGCADGHVERQLAQSAAERGVPAFRLAFRGTTVGGQQSAGTRSGDLSEAVEDVVACLGDVVEKQQKVVLMGYSFGSMTALHLLATMQEERIVGCLLVAPPLSMLPEVTRTDEARQRYALVKSMATVVGDHDDLVLGPYRGDVSRYDEQLRTTLGLPEEKHLKTTLCGVNHFFSNGVEELDSVARELLNCIL